MADQTLKRLLIKFGIDPSEFKAGVAEIRRQMKTAFDEEQKQRAGIKKTINELHQKEKEIATQLKSQQVQVKAVDTGFKAQLTTTKLQETETKKKIVQEKAITDEIKRQLVVMDQQLKKTKQQETELQNKLRQQQRVASTAGAPVGGPGGLSGFAVGGLGVLGGLAGGLLVGLGMELMGSLRSIVTRIKSMGQEAAKEEQAFATLTYVMGGTRESALQLVTQLTKATKGLVDDGQLVELATVMFRNNSKMTQGQLLGLAQDSMKLAVSIHGPEGAAMAMNALNVSMRTGRAFALAYSLGLSRQLMTQRDVTRGLSAQERLWRQWQFTMKLVHEAAAKVPEPLQTLQLALLQNRVAVHNLLNELAKIIQTSPTLIVLMQAWTSIITKLSDLLVAKRPEVENAVNTIGLVITDFVRAMLKLVDPVISVVETLLEGVYALKQAGKEQMADAAKQDRQAAEADIAELKRGGPIAFNTSGKSRDVLLQEAETRRLMALTEEQQYQKEAEEASSTRIQLEQARDLAKSALGQVATEINQFRAKILAQKGQAPRPTGPGTPDTGLRPEVARQVATMEAQNKISAYEKQKQITENALNEELVLKKRLQQQGVISEQQLAEQSKRIQLDLMSARLLAIGQTATQERQMIEKENVVGVIREQKLVKLEQETANKRYQVIKQFHDATQQLEFGEDDRARLLRSKQLDADHARAGERLVLEKQTNEEMYSEGYRALEEYMEAKRQLNEDELNELNRYLGERLEFIGDNEQARRDLLEQTNQKAAVLYTQLLALDHDYEVKVRAEAQQTFQFRMELLDQQRQNLEDQFQAGQIAPSQYRREATANVQARIAEAQARSEEQRALLGPGGFKPGTEQYRQAALALAKFDGEMTKLRLELVRIKSPFASFFNSLAQIVGMFSPEAARGFAAVAAALSDIKERAAALAEMRAKGTSGAGSEFERLQEIWQGTGKTIEKLEDTIQAAMGLMQGIANFAQVMKSPGGPVSGMLGGAAAGMQLGATFGPWGAAIGAIAGGIAGLVRGIFTSAAKKIAKAMTDAFSNVMKAYQAESLTLAQTIKQAEQIRADTIAKLSSKKGGRKELDQILPQMDEAIAQLKAQQKQILTAFEENLKILQLPAGLQDVGSQIINLTKQYKEYVDAGGDVVKANEWLARSFARLRESAVVELNQEYEDAIQNALDYNQLIEQRDKLLKDTAQAEKDILNQGVLVRQKTMAQTKGEAIAEIEKQKAEQLEQIDNQIKLAKYKLETESKLFDLTGSRVALENRLLNLKFQEIDADMRRIAALQNLLAQFAASGAGYAVSQSLQALLGLVPSTGLPTQLTGPHPTMGLEGAYAEYYDQRARFGQTLPPQL